MSDQQQPQQPQRPGLGRIFLEGFVMAAGWAALFGAVKLAKDAYNRRDDRPFEADELEE